MPKKIKKQKHRKNKSNKSRRNFLEENYGKSWQYLRESRVFIYAAVFFFLFFVFVGAFVPAPEIIEMRILELIEELLQRTEGMSHWELVGFILLNNAQSAFFGVVFGIVLGIFSLLTAIVNGYLLGFVAIRAINADGILVLWRLVPHGIFELPALFVSVGLGLKLGFPFISRYFTYFYRKENYFAIFSLILLLFPSVLLTFLFNKKLRDIQLKDFNNRFWNSLRVFVFIVIPLLILAAIIEGSLIFFLQ